MFYFLFLKECRYLIIVCGEQVYSILGHLNGVEIISQPFFFYLNNNNNNNHGQTLFSTRFIEIN